MNSEKTLLFVPSAYRDWSVLYCQLGWRMWVKEFRKQYGWGLSDICFGWDGQTTTLYRAPSEHLIELQDHFLPKVQSDTDYLHKLVKELYEEVAYVEEYYDCIKEQDFNALSWEELLREFNKFKNITIVTAPKVLISIYLPQAVEFMGVDKNLFPGIDTLIDARNKLDYILGPLGNKFTEKFCQNLVERLGIEARLGKFVSQEEFLEISSNNGLDKKNLSHFKETLNSRSSLVLVGEGRVWNTPIEEYLGERGWKLEQYDLNTDTLTGTTAFSVPKKISGPVKVVLNKRQLNKIEKGDIIVAPMTTPEYGPVFSKVSGIITDEGGVTCHAAIVAREMGIPTIVGTNIASKLLEDGRIVELDTSNGEITIQKH